MNIGKGPDSPDLVQGFHRKKEVNGLIKNVDEPMIQRNHWLILDATGTYPGGANQETFDRSHGYELLEG